MLLSTLHAWCQMVCWCSSLPTGSSRTAPTSGRTRLWEEQVRQQLLYTSELPCLAVDHISMTLIAGYHNVSSKVAFTFAGVYKHNYRMLMLPIAFAVMVL